MNPFAELVNLRTQLVSGEPVSLEQLFKGAMAAGRQRSALACLSRLFAQNPDDPAFQEHFARAGFRAPPQPPPPGWPLCCDPEQDPYDERTLTRGLTGFYGNAGVTTIAVLGPHLFSEREELFGLFPNLRRVYLFEPNPEVAARLRLNHANRPEIQVFQKAVSDRDGVAPFHLGDNDGLSSSLQAPALHQHFRPEIGFSKTIEVETVRLEPFLSARNLPLPEMLFLDVQGSEYRILASLSETFLAHLLLIFTEAATVELYRDARPLSEIQQLLAARFRLLDFAPLRGFDGCHGNALFLAEPFPPPPSEPRPDTDLGGLIRDEVIASLLDRSAQNRPLYIWGCGGFGKKLHEVMGRLALPVKGFIDGLGHKRGPQQGLPVLPPSALEQAETRPYVIIGSIHVREIGAHLERLGFQPGRDYSFSGHVLVQ